MPRAGNERVDFAELASGLSVLCGGPRDDKVEAAFALFDINGDGFISLEEMQSYLVSVFKVLYHLQPEIESRVGVGPTELGEVTAKQAFEDADLNHDGKISYDGARSSNFPLVHVSTLCLIATFFSCGRVPALVRQRRSAVRGNGASMGEP